MKKLYILLITIIIVIGLTGCKEEPIVAPDIYYINNTEARLMCTGQELFNILDEPTFMKESLDSEIDANQDINLYTDDSSACFTLSNVYDTPTRVRECFVTRVVSVNTSDDYNIKFAGESAVGAKIEMGLLLNDIGVEPTRSFDGITQFYVFDTFVDEDNIHIEITTEDEKITRIELSIIFEPAI